MYAENIVARYFLFLYAFLLLAKLTTCSSFLKLWLITKNQTSLIGVRFANCEQISLSFKKTVKTRQRVFTVFYCIYHFTYLAIIDVYLSPTVTMETKSRFTLTLSLKRTPLPSKHCIVARLPVKLTTLPT